MIRYLHIAEDGTIDDRTADGYWLALDEVGPEGWNRVQLTRNLAAFVNDCGLVKPYPRNPVAGALMHALGAPPIPYAGPIVLAGWDMAATARGEIEVVSLTDLQAEVFGGLARHIAAIVNATGSSPTFRPAELDAVWAAAELVRTADVPGITVTSLL